MSGDIVASIITLRLVNRREWRVIIDGRIVAQPSYDEVKPYILGRRPKSELIERYGREVKE